MTYILKSVLFLNLFTLVWFTALQFNDPDAALWIGLYALCSLIPLLGLFNKFITALFGLAILSCLIAVGMEIQGAYTYFQHRHEEALMQTMNPAKPYIEEAREFLGGLIALALVIISGLIAKRLKTQSEKSE